MPGSASVADRPENPTVTVPISSSEMMTALHLGGTLFVPATHKHLESITHTNKFSQLRSVVLDLEDGIGEDELENAFLRIQALLPKLESTSLLRFIRPKNPEVLSQLLALEGIEKIDGFIFPKFGLNNAHDYLSIIQNSKSLALNADTPVSKEKMGCSIQHYIMPSIEGKELFDAVALRKLRDILLPYQERIPVVRFGAEDMFRQLGLRRDCNVSLYDMAASSQVIGNLLTTFKPYGFDLAAPVYRCYRDTEGFQADVRRDLHEGLISKTIIHPDQIALLEELYMVSAKEYAIASEIMSSEEAVFAQEGTMAEALTQSPWARSLLERAALYGVLKAIISPLN